MACPGVSPRNRRKLRARRKISRLPISISAGRAACPTQLPRLAGLCRNISGSLLVYASNRGYQSLQNMRVTVYETRKAVTLT